MSKKLTMIAAAVLWTAALVRAQVPGIIQYQGRLTTDGTNYTGLGNFKFALIEAVVNGASVWSHDGSSVQGSEPASAVKVPVKDGLFIVGLGDTSLTNMTVIPVTAFGYADVRLRIWFNNGDGVFQQLSPDQRITSVGYAMVAATVPDGAIDAAKLADGAVTSGKIGPNSLTSTELADQLTLQRLDLGGPLWNGNLHLWAQGPGEQRGLLSADGNGSALNLQFANNSTGAVISVKAPGAKLSLWDAFGAPTALLGAGLGGGELNLYQLNGEVGILLDADKSLYGNTNSSGGEIEVRNASGLTRVLLDGDNNGAGRIDVRDANGSANVALIGSGAGGGGEVRVLDAAGNTVTAEVLGAETPSTGGRLTLREADGTSTIVLDAENSGGARVDLFDEGGMSRLVFLPGGGDATLPGGGLARIGDFNGTNLGIDDNEILARNNGAAAPLYLNYGAGASVFTTRLAINTTAPAANYELSVNGQIICEELVVQNSAEWPDYVFADDYPLMPLETLELEIREKKHLPGVPSAKEVGEAGIPLGEMQRQMMEKIEELTLYVIQQNSKLREQSAELELLRKRLDAAQ